MSPFLKMIFSFSYLMRKLFFSPIYFSNPFQIFLWYIPRENQAKNEWSLTFSYKKFDLIDCLTVKKWLCQLDVMAHISHKLTYSSKSLHVYENTVNVYYLTCQKIYPLQLFKIIENSCRYHYKIIQGDTNWFKILLRGQQAKNCESHHPVTHHFHF